MLTHLEDERASRLGNRVVRLQAVCRGHLARRHLQKLKVSLLGVLVLVQVGYFMAILAIPDNIFESCGAFKTALNSPFFNAIRVIRPHSKSDLFIVSVRLGCFYSWVGYFSFLAPGKPVGG